MRIISEDEFYEKYKPLQNHLDSNASFDGLLWETFGDEINYCFELAKKEQRVWTIVECDDVDYEPEDDDDEELKCCMYIISGFHYVNRIGFMVTEVPYDEETEVKLDL
jgi:hypothetical protein